MSACAFRIPLLILAILGLSLPEIPRIPIFEIAIPGFPLKLRLPVIAFLLSLSLPSLPSLPSFSVNIPGFPLKLRLPTLTLPIPSLALPVLKLFSLVLPCPLDKR